MEIRIYPTIIYNRFRALIIDGKTYLGVESAVQSYLKDNGYKLKDIVWKINDTTIKADNIDEFSKQFDALRVDFKGE